MGLFPKLVLFDSHIPENKSGPFELGPLESHIHSIVLGILNPFKEGIDTLFGSGAMQSAEFMRVLCFGYLTHAGYNVAKYVPYGPVRDVMPYLIRRARENPGGLRPCREHTGAIVALRLLGC